jgi:hypothetical protein
MRRNLRARFGASEKRVSEAARIAVRRSSPDHAERIFDHIITDVEGTCFFHVLRIALPTAAIHRQRMSGYILAPRHGGKSMCFERRTAVALALAWMVSPCLGADWLQFGYDSAHSSNNTSESILTSANVDNLAPRYSQPLPGVLDGAPVYLGHVSTPGGVKDLLFALSMNGTAMAIDAQTGDLVWSKSSGQSFMNASPAIDPGREFVYFPMPDGKIHKYAVGDGAETLAGGWPEVSTAKPQFEKANGSLAIATVGNTSYLYAVTSGFTDGGDYQGHLTTINLDTGAQVVFNSLCSDQAIHFAAPGDGDNCNSTQSGIWGRGGAVFDADLQRVFVTTGNGPYDASTGGNNWSDSVLALAPDGTPATPGVPYDSYTPDNFQHLGDHDLDLGSMSIAILPTPAGSAIAHIGMQAGKDENIRLINLDDLSGAGGPRHTGGEIQFIANPNKYDGAREQSAVWVDSSGQTWVFYASFRYGIVAYKVVLDAGTHMPSLSRVWSSPWGLEVATTSPVVANGVLYHIGMTQGASANSLVARDPATGNVLWSSEPLSGIHWQSPIVVDGVVYVSDVETGVGRIKAYGLSGAPVTHIVTPNAGAHGALVPGTPQTVNDGATTAFTVVPDGGYRIGSVSGCAGTLAGNLYTTGPITADCTVTASFARITHVVTPTATAGGTIQPSVPQTVDDGATVQFTLAPNAGDRLVSVTGCNGSLNGFVYTTGPITADCTVAATFAPIVTHIVTPVAIGGGTIAPDVPQTVNDGATVQFTLAPGAGNTLASVTGCNGSLSGFVYTTGPITADCTVTATFAPIVTHVVTPVATAGGTIEPDVPQTVDEGATVQFTLTPDAGAALVSATGCNGSLDGFVYTTGPITADCTVTATFAPNSHVVTPIASAGGTIEPDVPQIVHDGSVVEFTLTPDADATLDSVEGCGGSLDGFVFTTGPITADCTVSAVFERGDSIFANGFDPGD